LILSKIERERADLAGGFTKKDEVKAGGTSISGASLGRKRVVGQLKRGGGQGEVSGGSFSVQRIEPAPELGKAKKKKGI